jgi:Na+/melibiose symporter-like transporter
MMVGFQLFTLFGVREQRSAFKQEEKTTLRGMFKAILKNDQLLFAVIAMGLFMIGYTTTASMGLHYFKYAFRNADMYSIFVVILGASQIAALAVFPLLMKRVTRKNLYFAATLVVVAGYLLFFFSPMNMIPIGIAGMLIFVGQAFIEVLILMFLADTIEYGQWKSGKRNQGVTLSVQPLINKIGGAIATGTVSFTLIASGINEATNPADVTSVAMNIPRFIFFIRKKTSASATAMAAKTYTALSNSPALNFHSPSSESLSPPGLERSMVLATPVDPLMTRPGVFSGIRFPKMKRNRSWYTPFAKKPRIIEPIISWPFILFRSFPIR